jgi:nitronate monooxygenase
LFVCAREANAHPRYQQRILEAGMGDTLRSRAFEFGWPGREHRVLDNEVARSAFGELPRATIGSTMVAGRKLPVWRYSAAVPTRDTTGDIDNMALYCGQGCERIASVKPAAEILAELESGYWQCAASPPG